VTEKSTRFILTVLSRVLNEPIDPFLYHRVHLVAAPDDDPGIALVGVFLRVAPFARAAGLGRNELLEAVQARLGRFFGKRGGAVVDANLAIIAEAYDGLIDVSGAIGAGLAAASEGANR